MRQQYDIIKIICAVICIEIFANSCKDDNSVSQNNKGKNDPELNIFKHPGIINSSQSLDFIVSHANLVTSGVPDHLRSYHEVINFMNANPIPTNFPSVVYVDVSLWTPTEEQIRRDAILAYACALRWVQTSNSIYATQAKIILNGWAYNFQKYEVLPGTEEKQTWLEASWVAPTFAAAAEIIRHYQADNTDGGDWAVNDIAQFEIFLNKLTDIYINRLVNAVDEGKNHSNWGVTAGYAKMACGVFLNNKVVYNDGKRIILKLIPIIISSTGEVAELCSRDCGHPQYSMAAFSFAAEIDRIQGDNSIYTANSNRIQTGWEYIAKAFSGDATCRDCSTSDVHPGVEVAANYYKSALIPILRDFDVPYGVRSDYTFLGFTTYTHSEFNGLFKEETNLIPNGNMSVWNLIDGSNTEYQSIPYLFEQEESAIGFYKKATETYNGKNALSMTYFNSGTNPMRRVSTSLFKIPDGTYSLTIWLKGTGYVRTVTISSQNATEAERKSLSTTDNSIVWRPQGTNTDPKILPEWISFSEVFIIKNTLPNNLWQVNISHNNGRVAGNTLMIADISLVENGIK